MRKTIQVVLSILVIGVIGYFIYQNGQKEEPTQEELKTIKIGAILPLTGKLSEMGEYEKNAMKLAENHANINGKKIEIIFEDSKSNSKDAVSAVNKLLDIDKVDIIVSSTTGISLAVKPVVLKKQKNLVAFCMDANIATDSEYTTRYYIGINEESKGVLNYFKTNRNDSINVGILYAKVAALESAVNDIYLPSFKESKTNVSFVESYDFGGKNFNNLVLKMKKAQINHLIILGYGFEYPNIYKSLQEQNILENLQVLGGWGFLYTSIDYKVLEGTMVSGPDYLFKGKDKAKMFMNTYKNTYNKEANFDAAFAYEAIRNIAIVINIENVKDPIVKILKQQGIINGIVGEYFFDDYGNMVVNTALGEIKNGILTIDK